MAKEKVKDAVEVPNAARKARKPQLGHGDALSDATCHSNSGGDSNSATDPGNYKEK
jgi:hypothetical protein